MSTTAARSIYPLMLVMIMVFSIPREVRSDQIEKSQTPCQEIDRLEEQLNSPEIAAKLGLYLVHKLTDMKDDQEYAQFLGFSSAQEARQSCLGSPLQVFSVTKQQLADLQGDSIPDPFFFDTKTIVYPLEVNGRAQSSVSVVSDDGKTWHLARIGSSKFIQSVERFRTPNLNFIINISDIGLRLLSDRPAGKPVLVPLTTRSRITAGAQLSASDLSEKLREEPKNIPKIPSESGTMRTQPKQ